MKRIGYLGVLLSILPFLSQAAIAAPAAHVQEPPPPDYFPLSKDYWWKYESSATTGKSGYDVKVVDVEKQPDGTVVYDLNTTLMGPLSKSGFDEWYVKPKGQVKTLRLRTNFDNQMNEYAPVRQYIENPLKVGDTWSWSGRRFKNIDTKETSTVEEVEDVEVPAGKFKAMRVVTKVEQGGSPVTKTYWYAPWVGLVRLKTESGGVVSDTKLLDYSFKPKEKTAIE